MFNLLYMGNQYFIILRTCGILAGLEGFSPLSCHFLSEFVKIGLFQCHL